MTAPVARNAPCPCGSGLRYKNCCGRDVSPAPANVPVYPGWERLPESERVELAELMQRALAAQTGGDLAAARDMYDEVVKRAPETFDALHMLGVVCYQTGRLADAYAHLRRALDLTDWRVPAMRANLSLLVDALLASNATPAHGAASSPPAAKPSAPALAQPALRSVRRSPRSPRISIIVSTYNAAACLGACLEDLAAQTIAASTEIIVVDSGSQQDEHAVAKAFESRFTDLVYVRTRRETIHAAWNRALALARGEYVTNANTDDAHRSDALELMAAALEANPQADFAYSDYLWSDRANDAFAAPHVSRTVRHPPYHPAQAMFYCVLGCHPMWRRTLFDELGAFDAELATVGDYELLLRTVAAKRRPVHVAETLSLFYQNPEGLTFQSGRSREEALALQRRYRNEMPIDSLYAVDTGDPGQVAAAWTALGVLATGIALPWLDGPHMDPEYAVFCFRRALDVDPANVPAIANLATLFATTGHPHVADQLLPRLPAERAAALVQRVARGDPVFESPEVAPAVPPLEHAAAA